MKKGKKIPLNIFNDIKTSYGTVDSLNFKSLFVNLQTWVEPKLYSENWKGVIGSISRELKHSVRDHLLKSEFKNVFILDLDLRSSGITFKKKSFFNLEITLYPNSNKSFKSNEIKTFINELINKLYCDVLRDNKSLKIHGKTKNQNKKQLK